MELWMVGSATLENSNIYAWLIYERIYNYIHIIVVVSLSSGKFNLDSKSMNSTEPFSQLQYKKLAS